MNMDEPRYLNMYLQMSSLARVKATSLPTFRDLDTAHSLSCCSFPQLLS